MRFVVLVAMITCACGAVIIGLWVFDPVRMENERTYRAEADAIMLSKQRAEALVTIEKQKAEAAAYVAIVEAVRLPFTLAVIGLMLLGGAGGGLFLFAKGVQAWETRRKLAGVFMPDKRGLLPVSPLGLDNAATLALAGYHTTNIEAARNPVLPNTITKYTDARRRDMRPIPQRLASPPSPAPSPSASTPPLPTVTAPDWRTIQSAGLLAKPERGWLVGFAPNGEPIRSDGWDDWVHMAIAGLSRSGKSNTARLFLAQAAQRDMRLVVFDPHARHPDGVGHGLEEWPQLAAPVAVSPGDMANLAVTVEEWLSKNDTSKETLIVIDEWTRLLGGGVPPETRDTVARMAHGVVTSGAKFGLHLLVIGQGWTVDAASHVRDHLQMAYLHQLRPDQARLVTNSQPPRAVESLPTGQAMLWHDGGWQRVCLPRITGDDMRMIEGRVVGGNNDSPSWATGCATATGATGATGETDDATARADRIRTLNDLGWSRNRISAEIFGHKDDGTMAEIRAVLGPAE